MPYRVVPHFRSLDIPTIVVAKHGYPCRSTRLIVRTCCFPPINIIVSSGNTISLAWLLQAGDGCPESLPRYTGSSVRVAPSRRVGGDDSLRDPDDISEDDEEGLDDWGEAVDRAPSPRDGNTDCEGSSPSLSDGEDGGGGGSGGDGGGGNGKSVNAAPRKIGTVRVRGGSSRVRWGVARLLHTRLGGYMLPGAAGPDVSPFCRRVLGLWYPLCFVLCLDAAC